MKKKEDSGCLEYCFDSNCPGWDSDRVEELSCALIREFREMPGVGFRFIGERWISITRLQLLPLTARNALIRRAEAVYQSIMTPSL